MDSEPMKFHEIHSNNVQLSDDRTTARKADQQYAGICYTHRPLAPKETLVLSFPDQGSGDFVKFGLTETVREIDSDLTAFRLKSFYGWLEPGVGTEYWIEGKTEFQIYIEKFTNRAMIQKSDCKPREIIPNFRAEKPKYVLFYLEDRITSLQINSRIGV